VIVRIIFTRFHGAKIVLGSLLLGALLAGFAAGLSGEESRTRTDGGPTPIMRQEVWQAVAAELRQRGLAEKQLPRVEDLDLPGALPALAGRRLRVSSECWDAGPRRTQFRLQCDEPGECLPFLVYVRDDVVRDHGRGDVRDALNHDSLSAGAVARAGSCRLASDSHPAHGVPEAVRPPAPQPMVRAGDQARAVFLANGLRMTASVTCLERGREGEIIRVRGSDGYVFRARVSGPNLLEALSQQ
jgi:hypothetical protein